jgi:HlyD family secretion protein
MKKLKWILPIILFMAIVAYFFVKPRWEAKNLEFNYTTLQKGDIEAIVSSTGALQAINTVEVGTQISGTIKNIYVDFNDKVTKGQVLAQMDLKLLQTNQNNAKANVAVADAQLNRAKDAYKREKVLFEKEVISEQQYLNTKFNYEQAISSKKAALAALQSIEVNMAYARITSPISGTVTERSVEEGQTVAASFATPTLFIIAEDLAKMEILADVDESDIGAITNDMEVRFTVQTFPEKIFTGKVNQIRLQPNKINNVVNYQVVVAVDNEKGLLLPGMTVNLQFITSAARNVLLINNSALRFRPNEDMLKEIKPIILEKAKKQLPDSLQQVFLKSVNEETFTPANYKKQLPRNIDGILYQNTNKKLDFKFIELGIKSGLESEIKQFLDEESLPEGTKIINSIKAKK